LLLRGYECKNIGLIKIAEEHDIERSGLTIQNYRFFQKRNLENYIDNNQDVGQEQNQENPKRNYPSNDKPILPVIEEQEHIMNQVSS
jgi:hypothetical protein